VLVDSLNRVLEKCGMALYGKNAVAGMTKLLNVDSAHIWLVDTNVRYSASESVGSLTYSDIILHNRHDRD
jgi:hypothetical protein